MGSSINIFGLVVKGTNITMNRLNEIRSYLAMNEEIEFSYKGLECFITPNNIVWEFWINDECIIDHTLAEALACQLRTTQKTIQEIAYEHGFASQAQFSQFFRKQMGQTPSEWRRL